MVTVAPAMTAPEASVTEPRISPEFVFCASARPDTQIKTTKTRTAFIMECLRPKHGYLSRLLPALYAKPAAGPVPHLITRGLFTRQPIVYLYLPLTSTVSILRLKRCEFCVCSVQC